ncbi:hypothetical protein SAMD00019534_027660 [Acytostelium subglobosum LB1]|uniref:hypothetical protein n=1 Tax=Acytostelium subglobosum LB1 TaxID=1410327 RepID=UPI0006451443|nr:hypothetical protein SAMD00019534_027660 [Acytostelium subglobosum LB1]GAM19591.1 hypothetical protein SAMD00019534_027660 [Acytostelium subglobosum LB1]|eukprot:XP_012756353.1 hypothetical protein SAMD00019534_027660 [Acytostelium subglobosum LB1]
MSTISSTTKVTFSTGTFVVNTRSMVNNNNLYLSTETSTKVDKRSNGDKPTTKTSKTKTTTSTTSTTAPAKHIRYKVDDGEQVNHYSSEVNKYRQLEKGKRMDLNYKPNLPNIEPKLKEIDSSEVFSKGHFGDLELCAALTDNLTGHMQLKQPTHIQSASIPHILKKKDVMVKAQTGSGKTLAYMIPVVQELSIRPQRISRAEGCYCIIVAPTRELALQIFEVLQKLLKPFHWIVPGLIMGGESRDSEKARLRKGISILVATPGRLLDHLKMTQSFMVQNAQWLVLDEADRLLDLGFEKSINDIITIMNQKQQTRDKRQNILVSATLSEGINRLASLSLVDPVYVSVEGQLHTDENGQLKEEGYVAPKQLDQYYVEVESKERLVSLVAFLKWKTTSSLMSGGASKIIIFFSSCDSVEFHHYLFSNVKLDADRSGQNAQKANSIFKDGGTVVDKDGTVKKDEIKKLPLFAATLYKLHGDIEQKQRTDTFLNFKKAKEGILLTTDVAARGLDLPEVNWIVQYDPCSDTKEYIHRIGRTARLGHTGSALIFLTPSERKYIMHLNKYNIEPTEMNVTTILQSLYHTTEGQLKKTIKSTQLESQVHDLQLTMERYVLEDEKGTELARSAYQSSLRAYATHKTLLKSVFHIGSLHLGHVSKSFALRETPSELNKITAKQDKVAKKEDDLKKLQKTTDFKMKNYFQTNEFGNGLGANMANSTNKKRTFVDHTHTTSGANKKVRSDL